MSSPERYCVREASAHARLKVRDLAENRPQALEENQVAQKNGPLHPKVAHHWLKVAHNSIPLAFQSNKLGAQARVAVSRPGGLLRLLGLVSPPAGFKNRAGGLMGDALCTAMGVQGSHEF